MPKSRRTKVFHLTQVTKKTREQKEKLFENIRESIPKYQYCFVFGVDNMRNNYLKEVRHELKDCRIFFGKTKLTARAIGTTPEDAQADGIDRLSKYLSGSVGLLFTDRDPASISDYFSALSPVDFARAGAVAPRTFTIPPGVVYSTGGAVAPEDDVPVQHSLEPELRRLGMPTRMVSGKVVLGADATGEVAEGAQGYTICREGDVLDSRQTRLLKLFDVCMSEFRVRLVAYWTGSTGLVTELDAGDGMEGVEKVAGDGDEASDE